MTHHNQFTLNKTTSLCPVCLKPIPAAYTARDDEVWLVKDCPVHGHSEVRFWHGVEHFRQQNRPHPAQPPPKPLGQTSRGCPYDCGLCEQHRQATCCVLLEVTSGCNLACPVCFASAGGNEAAPSLDTIAGWYDMLMEQGGPFNIQLSGGEPACRDDLPEIIRMGKEKGFSFFQLNTNGVRIAREPEYLHQLKAAGLNTVFLQFDSPFPDAVIRLRGTDITAEKKLAIANCEKENLGVVLVPTLVREVNEAHVGAILDFAAAHMPVVRGVHFQPISYFGRYEMMPQPRSRITLPDLLLAIEQQSGQKLLASDFSFGGAEHPLCSCHADYEVMDDRWTLVGGTKSCCRPPSATSDTARKAVAFKWSAPSKLSRPETGKAFNLASLDEFIERRSRHTLAISAMAFQDVWTVDLDRLKRCYIHVVSQDKTLVPFCSYNLTAIDGTALHRDNSPCRALRHVTGGPVRPGGLTLTETAVNLCGLGAGAQVLDVGCGTGETVEFLIDRYGINAWGIDCSPKMLAAGKSRKKDLPIFFGRAETPEVKPGSLDAVFAECAFSRFNDQPAALLSFHRALAPGGRLVISDLYRRQKQSSGQRSIEQDLCSITALIAGAGFRLIHLADHTKVLRELTIKLIMEYGSLEDFYALDCAGCGKCSLCHAGPDSRLGYFLLIAEKT